MLYIQKHSIRYVPQYIAFVDFLKIHHEASVVELIFGIATDEKSDICSATDYFGKILVNERVLFFHTAFFPLLDASLSFQIRVCHSALIGAANLCSSFQVGVVRYTWAYPKWCKIANQRNLKNESRHLLVVSLARYPQKIIIYLIIWSMFLAMPGHAPRDSKQ